MTSSHSSRGYTLVELIVSVGLFSLVMTLAAGAYFIMINVSRQAQGVTTGLDSISFVAERMARSIRTGSEYELSGNEFSFTDRTRTGDPITITYRLDNGEIEEGVDNTTTNLTDSSSVTIDHMQFYLSGEDPGPIDKKQPQVTIVIGGSISTGAGNTETFLIQTGATMLGIDL
jgi:prepilin-type N-terminal cleavage/methylation domain-containing protein